MTKADAKVDAVTATGVDDFASVAAEGGPKLLLAVPVAEPGARLAASSPTRRQARKARKEAVIAATLTPGKPKSGGKRAGKPAKGRTGPPPVVRKAGKGMAVLAVVAAVGAAVRKLPVQRWARHTANRAKGLWHQCLSRGNGDTSDRVVADRIRSTLGPLEQELDVPRINVLVENGVALLHGDVGTDENVRRIVEAVSEVAGVRDVHSNLRATFSSNDTRPSEGQPHDSGSGNS